jgi:hypothetical protein
MRDPKGLQILLLLDPRDACERHDELEVVGGPLWPHDLEAVEEEVLRGADELEDDLDVSDLGGDELHVHRGDGGGGRGRGG